jgi:hypothetical protein
MPDEPEVEETWPMIVRQLGVDRHLFRRFAIVPVAGTASDLFKSR